MGTSARPLLRHEQRTVLPIEQQRVWERVASIEGINDELMPYMRMVFPRRHRGKTLEDIEPGMRVGKVWLHLGGVLPFDYDDLTITEFHPGVGFREDSTMLSMPQWRHTRTLRSLDDESTEVLDVVEFAPRIPMFAPVARRIIAHLFRHRHRRLAKHFDA
ncbi:MAG: hypothetical protein QM658_16990 [Gordonia sp. (in: high G+C Gram-positive bacteria)]